MTTDQIKSKLHKLIDNFEDEKILNNFYQAIVEFSKGDNSIDIIDELSEKQKQRLMDSIEQDKNGKTMTNEQVKDEIQKWFIR